MGICLFVNAVTDQCIINICQRDDLCRNRNFFPLQAIRIASSVVALMMPSADFTRHLYKQFILIELKAAQNFFSNHRMFLHLLKLFRRQTSWFVEDFFINADLSDIVE